MLQGTRRVCASRTECSNRLTEQQVCQCSWGQKLLGPSSDARRQILASRSFPWAAFISDTCQICTEDVIVLQSSGVRHSIPVKALLLLSMEQVSHSSSKSISLDSRRMKAAVPTQSLANAILRLACNPTSLEIVEIQSLWLDGRWEPPLRQTFQRWKVTLALNPVGGSDQDYARQMPRNESERQEQQKAARLAMDTSKHEGSAYVGFVKHFSSKVSP